MKNISSKITFAGIVGSICFLSFILMFAIHFHSTPVETGEYISLAIINVFIKAYVAILVLYTGFRLYETHFLKGAETDTDFVKALGLLLARFKRFFITILVIQFALYCYSLNAEMEALLAQHPDRTIWHYAAADLISLMQVGSQWLNKQLRIIMIIKNPCLFGYCLEDYPYASYMLAIVLLVSVKQFLKNKVARIILSGSINVGIFILTGLLNIVGQTLFSKKNKELSSSILMAYLGSVWDEIREADPWMDKLAKAF